MPADFLPVTRVLFPEDKDLKDSGCSLPFIYCERAFVYMDIKLYDEAIKDCNKAIELYPKNTEAYYARGLAYDRKSEYDSAIENYTKAIEFNLKTIQPTPSFIPDSYVYAYYNRGIIYSKKGDRDRAIKDLKKAVDLRSQEARKTLKEFFDIDY
ncbi:MAG TPA: hypothetical protein DCP53_03825 [Elusimicrobia bacterium]|nr:hypothetical protein [Elusimicrobiota bacterium]